MNKLKQIWEKVKLFFSTTKLGHFIKTSVITFSGIFFGMLVITPAWNAVFESSLPTIQEWKDLGPVLLDTLYRSVWAMVLVQVGIYKYSSSAEEVNKSNIVPDKK
jgi:hypothetical protein